MLGEVPARRWIQRLRGRPPVFSEADLVLTHFDAHPRRGVMIDVGAHYGESLEPYLRRGWRILAFEPDPANRAELARHVDTSRIRLLPVAVSDRAVEGASFFASDESTGISSLSAFRDSHRQVATVEVRTLRDVLSEDPVDRVDYLKIDTEGHDLFVLKGFPFDRLRPEVIVCEFEDGKTVPLGYGHHDLGSLLIEQGYQVLLSEWYPIERYGAAHRWRRLRRYPCDLEAPAAWGNFIGFRQGVDIGAADAYLSRFGSRLIGGPI